jgi:DNA-binding response OmpR family regulator
VAATSGEQALAELRRFAPNLIVVDDRLADEISGVELVAYLRQRLQLTLPIIMIAGQRETEMAGFEAGIDAFVAKPFISTDLITAIDNLLSGEARHFA